MEHKLEILDLVMIDIEEAVMFYESKKPELGDELKKCLLEGIDYILQYPLHCTVRYDEVRIKFIRTFPFGIYYILGNDTVKIIAFFHAKKNKRSVVDRIK